MCIRHLPPSTGSGLLQRVSSLALLAPYQAGLCSRASPAERHSCSVGTGGRGTELLGFHGSSP